MEILVATFFVIVFICVLGYIVHVYSSSVNDVHELKANLTMKEAFYKQRFIELHSRIDNIHDSFKSVKVMKGVVSAKYLSDVEKELSNLKESLKSLMRISK